MNRPGTTRPVVADSIRMPVRGMAEREQDTGGQQQKSAGSETGPRVRILVVFNSICLYGLERSIIETFASLLQDIDPYLLIPRSTSRYETRLLAEIQHWKLPFCYFSDHTDWPRIGKPRSLRAAWDIFRSVVIANFDVLKSAKGCDILYIPIITGLYLSFAASIWFRLTGRKVIYSFHDLVLKRSPRLWWGSRFVSIFIHLSEHSFQAVAAANPWITNKTNYTIPPAVAVRGRGDGVDPSSTPAPGGRNLLYLGQIAKHKGIDLLLEAFRHIAPEFPDVRLQIVGGAGWEYEGDFLRSVEDLVGAGRIKHWGYVGDVEPLLQSSYLYIQPTLPSICQESFGRGAVEAMWAGVPVVCFRSGALAEIVQHEVTGIICEVESADCLAAALAQLLSDPEKRNHYSQNCTRRYQDRYSKESIQRQWRALIMQDSNHPDGHKQ